MDTSISLGVGGYFLIDHPALWIGFIMLMVTPCTDWYLAFTGIAKGMCLSTSILPINLIPQVVLLPIYLLLFAGSIETIPLPTLIESILIVLIFPFVLAHLTRFLLRRRTSFKQYRHTLFQQCSDFLSIICDYGNVCFPRLILA